MYILAQTRFPFSPTLMRHKGCCKTPKVDFASLDVESIGEQVLQSVGEGDVSDVAKNLEKILPALHSIGGLR